MGKITKRMASKASRILKDGRIGKAAKSLAGQVLARYRKK